MWTCLTWCALFLVCKIPVFKGAAKPILGNSINAGHFHGMDGLGDAPDPNAPGLDLVQKEGAVSAMIRIVNENPGEVRDMMMTTTVLSVCVFVLIACLKFVCLSPGNSGCHGTAHQPGFGCEDGSFSAKQTTRALHHGRQHSM